VPELFNLIVDLDERFSAGSGAPLFAEYEIASPVRLDEPALAWIDETFGGTWSSEAHAGANVLARRDGVPAGFATFDPKGLRFAWLRDLGREPGVGVFGPFGVAESHRGRGLGRRLLHTALTELRARGYTRALVPAVGGERLIRYYADAAGARVAERFDLSVRKPARVLVMASGSGSNLQAVLDRARDGDLPIEVACVVVNRPGAFAIERARKAGVGSIRVLPWNRSEQTRAQYDERLLEAVRAEAPELVLLLGWMHLLAESFVREFAAPINVHPAFLPLDPERDGVGMPDGSWIPAFRGAHAVRDAIAAGSSWSGASVHLVTPQTDRGPVLARRPARIAPGEDEAAVLARLHPIEHELVATGIRRWFYER
jgi:phosphoribosylglycinamide formyltransferase 1